MRVSDPMQYAFLTVLFAAHGFIPQRHKPSPGMEQPSGYVCWLDKSLYKQPCSPAQACTIMQHSRDLSPNPFKEVQAPSKTLCLQQPLNTQQAPERRPYSALSRIGSLESRQVHGHAVCQHALTPIIGAAASTCGAAGTAPGLPLPLKRPASACQHSNALHYPPGAPEPARRAAPGALAHRQSFHVRRSTPD